MTKPTKRTMRIVGAVLLGAGLLSFGASFPFIASDPGATGVPGATGDAGDPAWFRALAPFFAGAIILGIIVLGWTIAHDLAARRKQAGRR